MKQYISEGEAVYMDKNKGLFSKKLAEWAIGCMQVKDPETKRTVSLDAVSLEKVKEILKENEIDLPEDFAYTAWYLYNMVLADYPKTCKTDEQRATFVEETICDPDGCPENVLACFVAKMCEAGIPIFWEKYL